MKLTLFAFAVGFGLTACGGSESEKAREDAQTETLQDHIHDEDAHKTHEHKDMETREITDEERTKAREDAEKSEDVKKAQEILNK